MGSNSQEIAEFQPFTKSDSGNRNMDPTSTEPRLSRALDTLSNQPSLDNSDASDKENSLDSSSLMETSFKSKSSSSIQDVSKSGTSKGQGEEATRPVATEDGGDSLSFLPLDEETPLFVTCGPNKAVLYLERLDKGSKGASILFDNWWLTPNEFQKISGRGTAKDWKRSIKHHGRSLKLLMAKNMLFLNPPQCKCEYCVSDASGGEGDNGVKKEGEADVENKAREEAMTSEETEMKGENIAMGDESAQKDTAQNQAIQGSPDASSFQEVDHAVDTRTKEGDESLSPQTPGEANPSLQIENSNTPNSNKTNQTDSSTNEHTTQVSNSVSGSSALQEAAIGASSQKADDFLPNGAKKGGNSPRQDSIIHPSEMNGEREAPSSLSTGNPQNKGNRHQKASRRAKTKPVRIPTTTATEQTLSSLSSMLSGEFGVINNEAIILGGGSGENVLPEKDSDTHKIDTNKCAATQELSAVSSEVKKEINCELDMGSDPAEKLVSSAEHHDVVTGVFNQEERKLAEGIVSGSNTDMTVNFTTEKQSSSDSKYAGLLSVKREPKDSTVYSQRTLPKSPLPSNIGDKAGEDGQYHSMGDYLLAEGYKGVIQAYTEKSVCKSPQGSKTPPSEGSLHISPPLQHPPPIIVGGSSAGEITPARQRPGPLVTAPSNPNVCGNKETAVLSSQGREATRESQENAAMSPKKEARLINIIEELKHYKKCLEVQIQEQKKSSTSPSNVAADAYQPPCLPSTSSVCTSSSTSRSSSSVSSILPIPIPTPNTSALCMIPTSFATNLVSSYSGLRMSSGYSGKSSPPAPKEGAVSDPTSHATGTVHWGMPKGHSPSHSSPTGTVIMSTQKVRRSEHSLFNGVSNGSLSHGLKQVQNGMRTNGLYSAAKDLQNTCQSVKMTAKSTSVTPPMYKNLVSNNNNNNNAPISSVDMNAYFTYLSECLKKGQMPNMYGYCKNTTPTKASSTENSPVTKDQRATTPRNMPQKRSYSSEPSFDDNGVLDLSMKRSRVSDEHMGYKRQSSEPVTLDEHGALDLSKK